MSSGIVTRSAVSATIDLSLSGRGRGLRFSPASSAPRDVLHRRTVPCVVCHPVLRPLVGVRRAALYRAWPHDLHRPCPGGHHHRACRRDVRRPCHRVGRRGGHRGDHRRCRGLAGAHLERDRCGPASDLPVRDTTIGAGSATSLPVKNATIRSHMLCERSGCGVATATRRRLHRHRRGSLGHDALDHGLLTNASTVVIRLFRRAFQMRTACRCSVPARQRARSSPLPLRVARRHAAGVRCDSAACR